VGVAVERVPYAPDSAGLDLAAVIQRLWERGVRSILCEGGGKVGSALLASGKVDRIYAFVAPLLLGEPGVPAFQGALGLAARNWHMIRRERLGDVTLLVLGPA
jgi:diaminohydroxyphosphoribosylaminopyrimidine deaminase/5-amino-6-(5-phosphoribosylamino)uracil reductase